MFQNTYCKLTIGKDSISYQTFNCEHILVFNAADNVSMIHQISITECRDDQINRAISIFQVPAVHTFMMSIFIRNKKGSFAKINNAIVNPVLVTNILCIPSNHSYVNIGLFPIEDMQIPLPPTPSLHF